MEKELRLKSSWDNVKAKIMEVHPEITRDDLVLEPGNEDHLLEKLALKLHKNKADLIDWIESVSANGPIAG